MYNNEYYTFFSIYCKVYLTQTRKYFSYINNTIFTRTPLFVIRSRRFLTANIMSLHSHQPQKHLAVSTLASHLHSSSSRHSREGPERREDASPLRPLRCPQSLISEKGSAVAQTGPETVMGIAAKERGRKNLKRKEHHSHGLVFKYCPELGDTIDPFAQAFHVPRESLRRAKGPRARGHKRVVSLLRSRFEGLIF